MDLENEQEQIIEQETQADQTRRKQALYGTIVAVAILTIAVLVSFAVESGFFSKKMPAVKEAGSSPFDDMALEAKAAYVYDITAKKELFSHNGEVQLPLASLTKLMVALVAEETLPKDAVVAIQLDAIREEGDSGFRGGERWNKRDLLDFTLLTSSNDGAHALASATLSSFGAKAESSLRDYGFIDMMNQKARELGLTQTYFLNETGLDTNDYIGGGYGSAHDVSTLLTHIVLSKQDVIEATAYEALEFSSLDNFTHTAKNTNAAVSSIPGLFASKTGFTELAGGNLTITFDAGLYYPIVITVLGSTQEGRFTDVEKLVAATFESLKKKKPID